MECFACIAILFMRLFAIFLLCTTFKERLIQAFFIGIDNDTKIPYTLLSICIDEVDLVDLNYDTKILVLFSVFVCNR